MAASLFQSTLNGSTTNLPDSTSTGRPFTSSFSGQSGSAPVFHHSGSLQGLHNIHGSFNVNNMPGSLQSRNSAFGGVSSTGVHQSSGGLSTGRFASNNLPVGLSQLSHGGLHGHSGVTSRGNISVVGSPPFSSSMNVVGGSIPGIPPTSASLGNRSAVSGLGVSPILGNTGPRLTNSIGNMVGASNVARNISSGGGLGVPALASRVNLSTNSGSGGLNIQGPSRLMSGVLQQAPQMFPMLGSSFSTSGGPLAQNQAQAGNNPLSTLGMPNDVNANDGSPFDINDFPQLTGRPSSAGGPQGQLGSLRKQGVGVSSIVQQSQEFSIQNEDFPALPGFKGNNADFGMDLHQKEAHHENTMSMMQSQHFSMGRSAGFSLAGPYVTHRQQQQQQQQHHTSSISNPGGSYASASTPDLLHLHGSDIFSTSHVMPPSYHSQVQTSSTANLGLRPMNNSNPNYDQLLQQYHQSNQSQFRMMPFQQSYRDQSMRSLQNSQATPDRFGLLGVLNVIKMSDPVLTSLALGIDLTTLGLNLNSRDNLHKTFASPWSDGPAKGDPEYSLPQCYVQPAPKLQSGYFSRFRPETLLYIFYSMPNDEAQLYAANELMNQGWLYHKELRLWLLKPPNVEPLVRTHTYERGTYLAFDPNTWDTVRKENFILQYDMIEKRPTIPQH